MRWILFSLCALPLSAQALDATYLTLIEPSGYRCLHQGEAWLCAAGDPHQPKAVLEVKGALLAPASKMTLAEAEQEQRKLETTSDASGHSVRAQLRYQHRVSFAGLDWTEAMKSNGARGGLTTHAWATVLPTQYGPFVISLTAAYPPAMVASMDKELTRALQTLHLSKHIIDYVEYLSVPPEKRDAALPQVAVGPVAGAKIPVCGTTKKMEMTVGTGRMMAFAMRAAGVAVVENTRALEILPTHVPYIMTTLLFSPMAEGKADVLVFDRTQKCKVRYSVAIGPDSSRAAKAPHEWTTQTLRTPSSAAEADAEYQRLGTAVIAGHLEAGNPVSAIPFPTDAVMWVSDPRIFDSVKLKPEKNHQTKLALIGKRPGTTTLVVLDATGRGHGYKVKVDALTMHVESMAMGTYENEL